MPLVADYDIVEEILYFSDVFDLEHLQSLPNNCVFVAYVKRREQFILPPLVVLNMEGLHAGHDTSKRPPGILIVLQQRES